MSWAGSARTAHFPENGANNEYSGRTFGRESGGREGTGLTGQEMRNWDGGVLYSIQGNTEWTEEHGTATGTGAGNVLEVKIIAQGNAAQGLAGTLAGNQGISDGEPLCKAKENGSMWNLRA